MKWLVFIITILMCSVCVGQMPYGQERVVILVRGPDSCSLSKDAYQHFTRKDVRQHMKDNKIQFVCIFGNDYDSKWRKENEIKYYPAVIYLEKGKRVRTESGLVASKCLGDLGEVKHFLGMKATAVQQVAPPQQIVTPQQMPQQQYVAPSNWGVPSS
jgi:hypothetical protein